MSADSPELSADLKSVAVGLNNAVAVNIKPLFKLMVQKQASDLFFTPFAPIKIKIEGKIFSVNDQLLTNQMVRDLAYGLMTQEQINRFTEEKLILRCLSLGWDDLESIYFISVVIQPWYCAISRLICLVSII